MESWREQRLWQARQTLEALKNQCSLLLVSFGGSIAYGTDTPDSDIDLRGLYLNPVEEWIGLEPDSQQLSLEDSDTVLFSLKKGMNLFLNCNPNVVELLGVRQTDILLDSPDAQLLRTHTADLLSKKAVSTFGGFAYQQGKRLEAMVRKGGESRKKLGKHMMHLIRVYAMGIDLLSRGEVVTYRAAEHELLMALRGGAYLDADGVPTAAFQALVDDYEAAFRRAADGTRLREQPDRALANALTMEIVRRHL